MQNFSGGVPQGVFIDFCSFMLVTTASHAESICKFNLALIGLPGLFISANGHEEDADLCPLEAVFLA